MLNCTESILFAHVTKPKQSINFCFSVKFRLCVQSKDEISWEATSSGCSELMIPPILSITAMGNRISNEAGIDIVRYTLYSPKYDLETDLFETLDDI